MSTNAVIWNGPVWLMRDYMVMEGLVDYEYDQQAIALVDKMTKAVVTQLRKNHNLWESFSADYSVITPPEIIYGMQLWPKY